MECAFQLRYAKAWIFQAALALCLAAAAAVELPRWREAEPVRSRNALDSGRFDQLRHRL
jgi:hypothetical protein